MVASFFLYAALIVYMVGSSSGEVDEFSFNAASARYTACVLHDNDNTRHTPQLPVYAAHPITLRSEAEDPFSIILFSAVQGTVNETCFSVIGSRGGNLIQDARCYGPRAAGYDEAELSFDTGDAMTLRLNDTVVFQQRDVFLDSDAKTAYTHRVDDIKIALHFTHTTQQASNNFIGTARTLTPIDLQIKPVKLRVDDMDFFNSLFGTSMQMVDVQHCWAFESVGATVVKVSMLTDPPFMHLAPNQLFDEEEYENFEEVIEEFMHPLVDPLAVGHEPEWASHVRTMIAVFDVLYLFLIALGRKVNGQFPTPRFAKVRVRLWIHIISGFILIYGGTALHSINCIAGPLYHSDDAPQNSTRHWLYAAYAASGIVHTLTVMGVLNQVMGERRITIPLYAMAGGVNGFNSIWLLLDPSLARVFFLWGSVNTFVFVRFGIFFMNFTKLDWNLLYTYGLLLAAFFAYPLSRQPMYVLWVLVVPILYGPFHNYFCARFGWDLEDPQDMSTKDVAFHHAFMAALGIRTQMEAINDGTASILSLSSYRSQNSGTSARERERRPSDQLSSSAPVDTDGKGDDSVEGVLAV